MLSEKQKNLKNRRRNGSRFFSWAAYRALRNSEAPARPLGGARHWRPVAAGAVDDWAATILMLCFAAPASPMGGARARNNASLFSPVTSFSLSMQARVPRRVPMK